MVDPHEANDPTMAAVRELEEETGYTSQRILSLGSFNPNPAIQTNRIHFFLALNCQPSEKRKYFPDPEEKIEISFHKPKDLDELVRFGHLDHALSGLCVYLAQKYIDIGAKNWA
jgi:8-oxo-dGTP pyrophosphatase MutT (NUDIX family)